MADYVGIAVTPQVQLGVRRAGARAALSRPGLYVAPRPEPLLSEVGDVSAGLTRAGRRLNARRNAEGLCFTITGFAVGTGGYYPGAPAQARPFDPAATGLENEVFRKEFVAAGLDRGFPIPESISFFCRLDKLEANHALGELMLIATIQHSPVDPAEVGQEVCYAIVNFPVDCHHRSKVCAWRTTITA